MINVLQRSVYAVLIAMGLVFLIPQNEIGLSVGGNYVLTGIVAALSNGAGMTGVPLSDPIISVLGGGALFRLLLPSAKACIRRSISANICSVGPASSCSGRGAHWWH